jgi:hypothetical protein
MKCPVDETVLAISERKGIEVDYCPTCRGVWLDRGELDKLLARAADEVPLPPPPVAGYPAAAGYPAPYPEQQHYDPRRDPRNDPRYRKKKKSFLSEFLDFD